MVVFAQRDQTAEPVEVVPIEDGFDLGLHRRRNKLDLLLQRSIDAWCIDDPPDRTMFPLRSFRMSTSHFMIEL